MVIHIERISRDKANGAQVPVGINTSNVVLTKVKIDKNRKQLIDRNNKETRPPKRGPGGVVRGEEADSENMAGVD